MEASDGIRDYVKEKVQRLEKYIPSTNEVHVVLSAEKFRHTAEITIIGNGATINGEGRDSDLYAAVDQMVEKIERQIRGRRGKARRKRTNRVPPRAAVQESETLPAAEEGTERPSILQRRQILAKPMSLDEAVDQLNLAEEDFLVFVNSDSGQMNVLCRKRDGSYEWVVPSE
jgi:putative sigma-54 modulation protein